MPRISGMPETNVTTGCVGVRKIDNDEIFNPRAESSEQSSGPRAERLDVTLWGLEKSLTAEDSLISKANMIIERWRNEDD